MSSYAKHLATTPYWIDSASMPRFPPVTRDERADVVVVGGGVAGLTTAYLLASAGRSVVVLERDRCAQVDTGHTSAHLTMVLDEPLTALAAHFGSAHAQAAWDAGLAAIAQIDEIVRGEQIACDFDWVPGYLHAPWNDKQPAGETFEREATLAQELGFDASYVDDVPVVGGPGVRFEDQARIHPRKYLAAVARAITTRGGRIYEHSEAQEFKDSPRSVRVNDHTITCGDIVLATHNPLVGLNNLVLATLFQTKLALYTTYVIAGRVKRGTVPDALFWDNGDPYYYLRVEPHRDHDVVIFGGQDHKTGQADDTEQCYTRLEQTLKAILPGIDLTNRWSGQVIDTPDGLPYIGESADHQFSGTGFSGNGLTFGTLTGMMARDHIVGRKNPWTDLFNVNRTKVLGGLWDYVKENSDYPYYLIRDRFAGPEGRSLRAVKRGEGKILEIDGERVAAYRRDDGRTIVRSAVCTHMGCVVEWNDAERTWDCPCHGSRFQPTGEVIAGPAELPLGEPGSKS